MSEVNLGGDWMRPAEGAAYMRMSRRGFAELLARRVIPFSKLSHRVVLIKRSDIDKAIMRRTIKAVA